MRTLVMWSLQAEEIRDMQESLRTRLDALLGELAHEKSSAYVLEEVHEKVMLEGTETEVICIS